MKLPQKILFVLYMLPCIIFCGIVAICFYLLTIIFVTRDRLQKQDGYKDDVTWYRNFATNAQNISFFHFINILLYIAIIYVIVVKYFPA